MAKLTRVVDGEPQFISDPPVLSRLEELVGADEAARFKATAEQADAVVQGVARRTTAGSSSSGTGSSTSPARSSASAASAPVPGSS